MKKNCFFLIITLLLSVVCQAQTNTTFEVNGVMFNMVFVEGGSYQRGHTIEQGDNYCSCQDRPAHKVTLTDFYIGETEVTQGLWVAVMGDENSSFNEEDKMKPVCNLTWDDCMTFLKRLNRITGEKFRLPTDAEWEFAARGGNMSKGYKYPGGKKLEEVAWCFANSAEFAPHDVATKKPNELGIYDMLGNAVEWCFDIWQPYLVEWALRPLTNPTGPENGNRRVLRGTWDENTHISWRGCCYHDRKDYDYGFRLAL